MTEAATGRQLWRLNQLGLLRVADEAASEISKSDAHEKLAAAREAGEWEPAPPRSEATAARISELRESTPGVTQAQAAVLLKLGERTVRRYWRGTTTGHDRPSVGHQTAPATTGHPLRGREVAAWPTTGHEPATENE